MDGCNCSVKKSFSMKEWMVQVDPPKEAITVKKINGRLLLLSSNKTTHYLKKISCLYKNLMFQIDPYNSSCSHKLQYPERKLRLYDYFERATL